MFFGDWVVGDPGIEPGMGLPGGVTVRCRTLQLVARTGTRRRRNEGGNTSAPRPRQAENPLRSPRRNPIVRRQRDGRAAGDEKAEMGGRKGTPQA